MSRKRLRRWKRLFERVAGRRCSLRCDRCCLYGGLSGGVFVVVLLLLLLWSLDRRILSRRFPIFSPFFLSPRLFFPSSFSPFPFHPFLLFLVYHPLPFLLLPYRYPSISPSPSCAFLPSISPSPSCAFSISIFPLNFPFLNKSPNFPASSYGLTRPV